jgi:tRNA (guanine37-N1)-methyltransferase
MLRFTVLTLFPQMFPGPLGASLPGRALERGLWACEAVDMRAFGLGAHRAVDDTPFGGGAGMVLRPDVVAAAARAVPGPGRRIYLSARGARLTQAHVAAIAAEPAVTLLCGRYEGVDQRALDALGFEELSIGDFVLAGGEVAALALMEAAVRLIPGVLGNAATTDEESFGPSGLLEYPHYTRPAVWEGRAVPEVLTSGDHGAVARWRAAQALAATRARRPDLLPSAGATNAAGG